MSISSVRCSHFTLGNPKESFFNICVHTHTHAHTHTHTTCLTALCPRLPGSAGTEKKKIWILLKQETVSGIGISSAICKSAPHSRQITTPAPHHSVFLQAECRSCRPTNSVKSTGGFTLFTIAPKKTNSNCCTAALAVYLQLFSAS